MSRRVAQERARFDRHRTVARQQFADRQPQVRRLQRGAQVGHGDTAAGHQRRVDLRTHRAPRPADRRHFARARHALQVGLDAVRHALEREGADIRVAAEQRQRDDRHVVDALGLDDRVEHAQAARQPVGIRVHRVVQPHQRLGARHADLELHRDHCQPRLRHRHHVLDAGHLRQHLFGRRGHHLFHVAHRCARKRDQHVGHRDVDLRLFLARCREQREQTQQQRHQRQQRRDLRRLEVRGDASGDAEGWCIAALRMLALRPAGRVPPLAGRHTGQHLDALAVGAAQPHLAQHRRALVVEHVDAGHLAAAQHCRRRHEQARLGNRDARQPDTREHAGAHAAGGGRQADCATARCGCRHRPAAGPAPRRR